MDALSSSAELTVKLTPLFQLRRPWLALLPPSPLPRRQQGAPPVPAFEHVQRLPVGVHQRLRTGNGRRAPRVSLRVSLSVRLA